VLNNNHSLKTEWTEPIFFDQFSGEKNV